jgi:hypothetical protein
MKKVVSADNHRFLRTQDLTQDFRKKRGVMNDATSHFQSNKHKWRDRAIPTFRAARRDDWGAAWGHEKAR